MIDENLSPSLTTTCHSRGYDATSTRDRGILGLADHELLALCTAEERVLVTENDGDFRALCQAAGIHPGLVVLPSVNRQRAHDLFAACLDYIERQAERAGESTADFMLNRVAEVDGGRRAVSANLPRE